MRHPAFHDGMPQGRCPRQHLSVDEETGAFGENPHQHVPTKHLERAIDIGYAGPQPNPCEPVVTPRQKASPHRIPAMDAVAHRDRCVDRLQLQQIVEIELTVGIGEGDVSAARGLESRPECRTVTAILGQPNHADIRTRRSNRRRVVRTAVVHDDEFGRFEVGIQKCGRFPNRGADRGRFVVGGQDQGEFNRIHAETPCRRETRRWPAR